MRKRITYISFLFILAYAYKNNVISIEMTTEPITQGWITTTEAAMITGYNAAYVRYLANQGLIEARKVGRDWLINQESLLAYKAQMDALGPQRHNPWREDLAQQGRGRNKQTSGGNQ
jgi:excisionase family DNA binding protein